jgi:hypothetical protein
MDFTAEHYDELQTKLLNAARNMKSDAWWLSEAQQPGRNKKMQNPFDLGDDRESGQGSKTFEGLLCRGHATQTR